ncbi:jg20145 [Pararge aegeria aegeria]|uniref:Jg20145 protein n=1 Tax=Pararge aegeria aegeria TaxID=348720 RepID=A0A8S4SJN8_9NEOP|nr:jg20145 [Pararge aegeria aegeria]
MNEGAPMMYNGGGFDGPGGVYMVQGQARHYPLEMLQVMGGMGGRGGGSPRQGTPRRWQPRKDRQPLKPDNAFGYDSDDSSLSSNASGSNKSSDKGSQYDTLSQEIWDKFMKSQQTEETFRKKMNLWRYLYITIKSIFPRYGLYVVGSTMSGFGLDSSDMDLCLYVRALADLEPRAHALVHLNHILGYIKSFDPSAELIHAKVPILKFRDERNGLQVDLNCNNVVGIRNTNLLYCYSRMDWRVRPLVALTKLWARAHRINDARRRTLSSYALTLMVIHFLQCGTSPAVLPRAGEASRGRAHNRCSLGELFLSMLKYYADFPAVRPDQHSPHGVRPGDVREDRGNVPRQPRAPRRRPAPAGLVAAAMIRRTPTVRTRARRAPASACTCTGLGTVCSVYSLTALSVNSINAAGVIGQRWTVRCIIAYICVCLEVRKR